MRKRRSSGRDIVHRWEGNPIITMDDVEFRCLDIRNAGVVLYEGEPLLLVSVEELSGVQSIHLARRAKEGDLFHVDPKPFMSPSPQARFREHEIDGVLDGRVTFMDGVYYIMYLARGAHGYRLGLGVTESFTEVKRIGLISEPDTKAGALFPEKLKGRYARLERPRDGHSIWVSYSEDLTYWGDSEVVLSPRGGFWDSDRVGAGPPPMRVEMGWLLIYYGAKETGSGPLYRLGAAILDANEPTQIVGRANIPILSPREYYERIGDVGNLVFSTGALIDEKGKITIYYGAADSCICVGTVTVDAIVSRCLKSEEDF
ncbi:MAG: glycoside hydrolase family 130 protein [Kiritimatiellae bacterium]|nr:glycoside hydrolase family 130 protein [Kiritimatiellia bacterium]